MLRSSGQVRDCDPEVIRSGLQRPVTYQIRTSGKVAAHSVEVVSYGLRIQCERESFGLLPIKSYEISPIKYAINQSLFRVIHVSIILSVATVIGQQIP